jgi:hypothetical protein
MPMKKHRPEQIVAPLRQIEVEIANVASQDPKPRPGRRTERLASVRNRVLAQRYPGLCHEHAIFRRMGMEL